MKEVKSDRAAEAAQRQESPSCSQPAPVMSRGYSHRQGTSRDAARQAPPVTVAGISEAIRAKVASRMHQTTILDLITTDEESGLKEEPTPEPKRKNLKSGKLRTADSTVLHKLVWLHRVVYTTTRKPAEYNDIPIPLFSLPDIWQCCRQRSQPCIF